MNQQLGNIHIYFILTVTFGKPFIKPVATWMIVLLDMRLIADGRFLNFSCGLSSPHFLLISQLEKSLYNSLVYTMVKTSTDVFAI